MSKAKQREQRNILIVVAVAVFMVISLFAWSGYNPLAQPKTGTSHTTGANIASTNTAAMTIYYSDGSHSTPIKSTATNALSIMEEGSGKQVSSINTNLNMIPTFTGTISSYTINPGTFSVSITGPNANYQTNIPVIPGANLPSLTSGQSVIVCSSTVNTNTAPFASANFLVGTHYTLTDTISGFSISGTFSDGSTFGPISAGTATITWGFLYESGNSFSGLTVNFALSAS